MFTPRLLVFVIVIVTIVTAQNQLDRTTCYQEDGKGCFFFPEGCDPLTNCSKAVSWKVVDGYLNMELTGVPAVTDGSLNFIAVGFSSDRSMGDEPVSDCTFGPQGPAVHLSYNPSKSNTRITDYAALADDLILTTANANNGRVYCAFRQRITPTQSHNRVLSLDRPVYLLLAVGPATDQGLSIHDTNPSSARFPMVTANALNLAQTASYGASSTASSGGGITQFQKLQLIKAHGIMMILAWFIFVATAIMFARYFRGHWPETKPMGLLLWFHFHRTLNVIGVILMIAAFVCIFVAREGVWVGPKAGGGAANSEWGSVHSMTGILAVCLAWVQPIGAIFRCHPGKPLRPIFNWLHRFIGVSAWLLAATTITIAAKHFTGLWSNPTAAYGLVIAYLVFIGLILVLQELLTIYDMVKKRQVSHVDVLEMQAAPKGPSAPTTLTTVTTVSYTTNSKTKSVRLFLLALFIIVCWGIAIAMTVLLGVS
uniref:Ferric-chelate reductase 1 n=2 Tax=Plectus sambesii TaxID=2011161 RepID=A0A914W8R8_9BILA